jgi:hypothetical protein
VVTEPSSERREVRRVPIAEAAEILGISKDAVRMRIRRGTLRSEKSSDKVHVLLVLEEHADQDTVHSGVQGEPYRELVDELRDRVRSLEETNRENMRIIAALTQRILGTEIPREQTPSRELPQTPETAAEGGSREEAGSTGGGPQQPSEPPPEQEEGDLAEKWSRSTIPLAIVVVLALIGVVVFVLSLLGG